MRKRCATPPGWGVVAGLDRTVFQGAQTESQTEELRGHQRKRLAHPDLDSLDRYPAAEMAAPSLEGQVVPVQSRLHVTAEPLYLS